MWGTSSPDGKLACDIGNVFEGTRIGGRQSDRLSAGKLSSGNFGLLQQYQPTAAKQIRANVLSFHVTAVREARARVNDPSIRLLSTSPRSVIQRRVVGG